MSQNSRFRIGVRRQKQKLSRTHNKTTANEPASSLSDGKAKRVFKLPRREESRYSLKSGNTGSRLSLQEVFNRAHAEYEGCRYDEDEPLNQADVYGINRYIRSHIYDIKKLERGELTFRKLMRQYPIFLNELRGIIERKWDILQRCKAQWGVDWAIQRVLQRDRIYPNKRSSRSVRSGGSRRSDPATSDLITRSSRAADSSADSRKESSLKHEKKRFTAGDQYFQCNSDDNLSDTDIDSEKLQSGLKGTDVECDDGRNGNERFTPRRCKSKRKCTPKRSPPHVAKAINTQSALEDESSRVQMTPGSSIDNQEVHKTSEESSEKRTSSVASSGRKTLLRHGQRRNRRITVSDSEEEEPPRRAPKRQKTVRRLQQKKRVTRGTRNK